MPEGFHEKASMHTTSGIVFIVGGKKKMAPTGLARGGKKTRMWFMPDPGKKGKEELSHGAYVNRGKKTNGVRSMCVTEKGEGDEKNG